MLAGHLLDDVAALEPYRDGWDELAVEARQPYCAPGWMLAWWQAAAPKKARLRVALALESDRLVGIAPFYAERRLGGVEWLRLLAAPISSPTAPLARTGREREAARALAQALAGARPTPGVLAFDGVPDSCPLPRLLAEEWPGARRARVHTDQLVPAPTVALDSDTLDTWLAGKSKNFRGQVRRLRRQLDAQGATFVRVGANGDMQAALGDMARLHHGRWEERGGSGSSTIRLSMCSPWPRRTWLREVGSRSRPSSPTVEPSARISRWRPVLSWSTGSAATMMPGRLRSLACKRSSTSWRWDSKLGMLKDGRPDGSTSALVRRTTRVVWPTRRKRWSSRHWHPPARAGAGPECSWRRTKDDARLRCA